MAKNKKRPKYVEEFINEVNASLKFLGIKDESNDLFIFACGYLLKHKMYEGFNFYKRKNVNGEDRLVLAGTPNKDKFDCLQLY
jgi:hypothetical protein